MKTFRAYLKENPHEMDTPLTETFNTVYPWYISWQQEDITRYKFSLPSEAGSKVGSVEIWSETSDREATDTRGLPLDVVTVIFTVGNRVDITGLGEGIKFGVFATVIDIMKDYIKKYHPYMMVFAAEKFKTPSDSRERLYTTLIRRFADAAGYRLTQKANQKDYNQVMFTLQRK